jgi:hypothetical protein
MGFLRRCVINHTEKIGIAVPVFLARVPLERFHDD